MKKKHLLKIINHLTQAAINCVNAGVDKSGIELLIDKYMALL